MHGSDRRLTIAPASRFRPFCTLQNRHAAGLKGQCLHCMVALLGIFLKFMLTQYVLYQDNNCPLSSRLNTILYCHTLWHIALTEKCNWQTITNAVYWQLLVSTFMGECACLHDLVFCPSIFSWALGSTVHWWDHLSVHGACKLCSNGRFFS